MPQNTFRPGVRSAAVSESGSILILTALSIVVMMGIAALAVDASFMYTERNRMAAAADAGAKAAALEYHRLQTLTNANLREFAKHEALLHGFDTTAGSTVTLNRPPSSGSFTSNPNYVEVIVSRPTNTFFAPILGSVWSSVTPAARAVAGTSKSPLCMYVLGTASDALSFENGVVVNMPNCGIADAGGADVGTSTGTQINTAGVGVTTPTCPDPSNMPNCTPNAPAPTDPLVDLPWPAQPANGLESACPSTLHIVGTMTIHGGTYCGLYFEDNSYLIMSPGQYYITGEIRPKNPGTTMRWEGTGVTIFIASPDGYMNIDSNDVRMDLTAPSSGTYRAILFYQQRGNTHDANFSKNNTQDMRLSGAIYVPDGLVYIKNNNGVVTNDCTLIVAKTVDFNNNSNLDNSCSSLGGSPLMAISLAE